MRLRSRGSSRRRRRASADRFITARRTATRREYEMLPPTSSSSSSSNAVDEHACQRRRRHAHAEFALFDQNTAALVNAYSQTHNVVIFFIRTCVYILIQQTAICARSIHSESGLWNSNTIILQNFSNADFGFNFWAASKTVCNVM